MTSRRGSASPRPPRLARWLFSLLVPHAHRAMLNDLDEEYRHHAVPSRGLVSARAWYWRQVLASFPGVLRLRRGRGARPASSVGSRLVRGLAGDIRFAGRLLIRRRWLTVGVTITLGIGIAVTTAALALAGAALFRDLPYAEPDRLVTVAEFDSRRESSNGNLSWPDFLDYARANSSLLDLAAYSGGSRTLRVGAETPDRVVTTEISANFLRTLGVRPALGRDFVADDMDEAAPPVVMLTHQAWTQRLGADPAVVGRRLEVGGAQATVIGVLPESFEFPLRGLADIYVPMRPSLAQVERRFFHWLDVVGRLRPGVSLDQAREDLGTIARGFATVDPEYHPAAVTSVEPLAETIVGDVRPMLLVLLGSGLLLFAIAASNIAGLLVARASTRGAEIGVRAAVGATRWRIVRQLLVESVMLTVPAVVIGLVAGVVLVRWFVAWLPDAQRASLPHLSGAGFDPAMAIWTSVLAVTTAAALAIVPALRLARSRQAGAFRSGVGAGRAEVRMQAGFVAAQVALAVVLLSGAGLMARSVWSLAGVSPGFDVDGLLTMRLTIVGDRYPAAEPVLAFHRELLERVEALPGIESVATVNQLPLTGQGNTGTFLILGQTSEFRESTRLRTVSRNYFDVMGIPVVAGRRFSDDDRPGSPPVLMVNQTFSDLVFGGDAVGQRISFSFNRERQLEIIGVVGDERYDNIEQAAGPVAYYHYGQSPERGVSIVARTAGDPAAFAGDVRRAIGSLDPTLPVFAVRTMRGILETSDAVFRRQIVLWLVGTFAAAALVLSLVGLYSVVARTVAARTREIGVRVTLGAQASDIARVVLLRGLAPAAVGLGAGLAGSALSGRLLTSLLFDTSPADPITLALVAVGLAAVATCACAVPTLRALRIDPVEALRPE